MSPRAYDLGRRRDQIDDTRRRVVDAARDLLADASRYTTFTVDAVAKRADVARATVYYQFGSKTGLLEALCDALAERGHLDELAYVFGDGDAMEALDRFVTAFGQFWSADRVATRRLRALARLDPEVGAVIEARDERRRAGLGVIVDRLAGPPARDALVRMLHALTSFELFDTLAGADRAPSDVIPEVIELAHAATGLGRLAP
jgi:AcrR family transcriptional regulator